MPTPNPIDVHTVRNAALKYQGSEVKNPRLHGLHGGIGPCRYRKVDEETGTVSRCLAGQLVADILGEDVADRLTESVAIDNALYWLPGIPPLTSEAMALLRMLQAHADAPGLMWGEAIQRTLRSQLQGAER